MNTIELQPEVVRQADEERVSRQELQKEMGTVLRYLCHALRSPSWTIDGYLRLMEESLGANLDEKARQHLDAARHGLQRLNEITASVADLAKISLPEVQRKGIDLSALAGRVADRLQREDPAWQGEFVIQPGLVGEGDEVLLEIALRHLFHNALKFSQVRSWAQVEFGQAEQDAAYYVHDNGLGFDPAYSAKLFCPFQHLHAEKSRMGRGIGLALVRRIIHQHGGKVWAQGMPDQGATFYFTLASEE